MECIHTEKELFMKRLVRRITGLTLLMLLLTACLHGGLQHKVTYSHKGTRSEARHGYLYLDEKRVPDCFTMLVAEGKAYSFFTRSNRWGNDGYFQVEKAPTLPETSTQITAEQKKRGWYKGKKRLTGTPEDWVYVRWKKGEAYANLEGMKKLKQQFSIPRLPRRKGLPGIMMRKRKQ